MTPITDVLPGDILAVRTDGLPAEGIRFGAELLDIPNIENHIAVMHHRDDHGTPWCIEAKPGGVGWRDATDYLNAPFTITNRMQTKTGHQRDIVCNAVENMLHAPYDWRGIAEDALDALHIPELWGERWNGQVPAHVVCSSLAAWAYGVAGLPRPTPYDLAHCQPGDWTAFILSNKYE